LGDNFTISLAEAVVMAIHELPKGQFIGENTWGATGPMASGGLYYGGSFTVPGFMNVSESSAEFKYYDGKIHEGLGFSPDIQIGFNLSVLNSGRDISLETAINKVSF
jgi:carboxyl-terminal processing protease